MRKREKKMALLEEVVIHVRGFCPLGRRLMNLPHIRLDIKDNACVSGMFWFSKFITWSFMMGKTRQRNTYSVGLMGLNSICDEEEERKIIFPGL